MCGYLVKLMAWSILADALIQTLQDGDVKH